MTIIDQDPVKNKPEIVDPANSWNLWKVERGNWMTAVATSSVN